MKAVKIKNLDNGRQVLWRCEPPYREAGWDDDGSETVNVFVVTSRNVDLARAICGPECYAFPANSEGKITSWGELRISQKGDVGHEQLWLDAGWEVA